ncbi:hypothetical protein BN946_scf184946.g27 [Trametes cinnabarina]|uniref:Xylanolytic transcriptional activator regulatory domain-containing protein n=1 Tax=Pycnoporus cinnabarinus TaxID=5643 RepID=A0A060SYJ5_PYCCI|nr:hypothetical protein BN946_scf184946.g27 [Trametes cinnabarina]
MSSTDARSQSVIEELRKDELAAHILETVDDGPFGRAGREKRAIDPTKDNFFSSIVTETPKAQSHRARRESRATRETVIENVISRDPHTITTRPTLAWQDRLSERLSLSFGGRSSTPMSIGSSSTMDTHLQGDGSSASERPRTRRRMGSHPVDSVQLMPPYAPQRPSSSRVPAASDVDLEDCADAFGNLSIDENHECQVRYHGNSSGLHLLVQAERTDGRATSGIWKFPMAKIWPGPDPLRIGDAEPSSDSLEIRLPPESEQRRLLDVYFRYVNPAVPVVDEETFMAQYETIYPASDTSAHPTPPVDDEIQPERPQKLSNLLLFAMFSAAASYLYPLERQSASFSSQHLSTSSERDARGNEGRRTPMTANEYTSCARRLLDTMYHESRSSTVQALVLLGLREFGVGSLEEGWLHVGMAIRMALDLGLNRNPDKWERNGRELFSAKEKEIRKQIWWSCCIADKFSALSLGRTIAIREGDFSTPLLEAPPDDTERLWRPSTLDPRYGSVSPVPGMYISYLRYMSSLYVITGEIVAKIYRVSRTYTTSPRTLRQQLYNRLLQWALELPEHLHYSYWTSVVLLHRPFIPKGADLARANSPSLDHDPVPWESYDICQSAATQIASFAMLYHEKYDMRWAPPFLSNCLQTAGIMHVLTLKHKPLDAQASVSLQKCIKALAGMEGLHYVQATWGMAVRVRQLIQNAKVNIDRSCADSPGIAPRQKRDSQAAFELDEEYRGRIDPSAGVPTSVSAHVYAPPPAQHPGALATDTAYPVQSYVVPSQPAQLSQPPPQRHAYPESDHQQPYAQRLPAYPSQASATPTVPSFAGYMPGYDSWWPVVDPQGDLSRPTTILPHNTDLALHAPVMPAVPDSNGMSAGSAPGGPGPGGGVAPTLPNQEFTFGHEHFSSEFLQAMRDPVLHFPSVFLHQP